MVRVRVRVRVGVKVEVRVRVIDVLMGCLVIGLLFRVSDDIY
jgi:hypothetical protein